MDKISKQNLQFSIVSFFGLAISVIASLFIYPLDFELYGKFQFLISVAKLLVPLFSIGVAAASIKFFTTFSNKDKIGELIGSSLLIIFSFSLLYSILFPFLKDYLSSALIFLGLNEDLVTDLGIFFLLMAFLYSLIEFFNALISNFQKITIPVLLSEFSIKVLLPILVIWGVYTSESDTNLIKFMVFFHLLLVIILWIYSKKLTKAKITFTSKLFKSIKEKYFSFSFYSMFNSLAYILVYRIDIIMISFFLGLKEAGYYSLIMFLASVIEIPAKGIQTITGPLIAQFINEKKLEEVRLLYTTTSKDLMLICGIFGLILIGGSDSIFLLMKNGDEIRPFLLALVFLIFGKWINQTFSINSHIINYSRYYRYNIIIIGFQALLNLVLNYYLIGKFGLLGAAIATAISIVLNNLIKLLFIGSKMLMWPFSKESSHILFFLSCFCIVLLVVPSFQIPLLDLLIRSVFLGCTMLYLAFKLNLSKNLNVMILDSLAILKNSILKFKNS